MNLFSLLPRSYRGRCPSLRGRRGRGFSLLAAILCLTACESEQKQTITAPTRPSTSATAKERPAQKTSAGSTRTSKPLTSDATKKPTPTNAKPTSPGSTTKKPTTDPKQATAKPGVKPPAPSPKPSLSLPPATYAEIAKAYNARAARLQRIWGRAVVSVEFTDDEGNKRWEQGEGHFQVIQPSKMALSAGKLSEVMLWIGCDTERYWFIDAKEEHRAWIGKHAAATREKIESLGMPAAPRDLLALAGITPLPKPTNDKRRDPQVRWSNDKKTLIFDADRAGSRWRYFINPKTYEPSRIEVIDSGTDEAILSATLEKYESLGIKGDNFPPRIATRFRCLHHSSGSTLGLTIADMTDGGTGRLRAENFDFDALKDLLGIRDVVDLDAPAKRPAAAAIGDTDR